MIVRQTLLLSLFSLFCVAGATEEKAPKTVDQAHYFLVSLGRSRTILGTSEIREGVGFAYGYGRSERRLSIKGLEPELVHYVHAMREHGSIDRLFSNSFGYEAAARYRFPVNSSYGTFVEIGWGISYSDHTSEDIDTRWNSTPMLGTGLAFNRPGGELLLSMGWYHVSNGGTDRPNHGQNYLHLSLGWRY